MDGRLAISLYRHGMTKENERSAYIGWTDSPLSVKGKRDIKRLKPLIDDVDIVFSSPLRRCVQTAALLFPEHEMIKVHSFKEIHFGAFEGKTYEQLKEDSNYQRWMAQPFTVRPPKGETFVEFSNRIQKGWQFVRQKMITLQLTSIAIVTHGGVIRYLLSLFASNRQSFFTWSIPFAGGYRLIWTRGQFLQHKQAESVKSI